MEFSRRSLLAAAGVTLSTGLAGCNAFSSEDDGSESNDGQSTGDGGSAGDDGPLVASQEFSMEKATCLSNSPRYHSVSVSYDESNGELSVNGTLKSPSPCPIIDVTTETGDPTTAARNSDIEGETLSIVVDPSEQNDCPRCPAEARYSGTLTLNENPPNVVVYHVEKTDDGWERTEPIETRTPSEA
jgi:hypothetical protein